MPNPQMKEYGLRHQFSGYFELSAEDETKNSFILPIIGSDQGLTGPENVMVNPYNDNRTSEYNHNYCYMGSRVNKVHVQLGVVVPPAGQETGIQGFIYNTMPMALSFDDIDIEHSSGNTVGSLLEVEREASNSNKVQPIWSGTDITGTNLNAAHDTLTTDQKPESVDFNDNQFEDAMKWSRAAQKIKSITEGGLRTNIIYKDRPQFYNNWIDVPSKCVRMNDGTFYGMLFHLPQGLATTEGTRFGQIYTSDETTAIDHLRVIYKVEFNEYNDLFHQEA